MDVGTTGFIIDPGRVFWERRWQIIAILVYMSTTPASFTKLMKCHMSLDTYRWSHDSHRSHVYLRSIRSHGHCHP